MGISTSKDEYSLYQPLPSRFRITAFNALSPFNQLSATARNNAEEVEFKGGGMQFVEDPDIKEGWSRSKTLLKLCRGSGEGEDLKLNFEFEIGEEGKEGEGRIQGLSFVCASNPQALHRLLVSGANLTPNFQNSPSVHLLSPSSRSFTWTFAPPPLSSRSKGYRVHVAFVEYIPSSSAFSPLACFSFLVERQITTPRLIATYLPSPPMPATATLTLDKHADSQSPDVPSSPLTNHSNSPNLISAVPFSPKLPTSQQSSSSKNSTTTTALGGNTSDSVRDLFVSPKMELSGEWEDGPLFRATLSSLEKRVTGLRKSIKSLIKVCESLQERWESVQEVEDKLDEAFGELGESNPASIRPLQQVCLEEQRRVMKDLRRDLVRGVEVKLLEQLRKLGVLMKTADAKRRVFESESKGYYDHVSKYLSLKNEGDDTSGKSKEGKADAKYKNKRDQFHVARIDYHNFLYDLAVFKEIEVLSLLTRWSQYSQDALARASSELQTVSDRLEKLDTDVEEARSDIEIQRRRIEESRREVEIKLAMNRPEQRGLQEMAAAGQISTGQSAVRMSIDGSRDTDSVVERSGLGGFRERVKNHLNLNSLTFPSGKSSPSPQQNTPQTDPKMEVKFKGIRDLEPVSIDRSLNQIRKKEGFLWASSRPSVQGGVDTTRGWHKFWAVLASGQLIEYTGWRESLEVHGQPINLRFATVRESRSLDRRFTFEVITPTLKRVYQATSDADLKEWIAAISNSIEALLNGTSTVSASRTPTFLSDKGGLNISGLSSDLPTSGIGHVFSNLNKPLSRKSSHSKARKRESLPVTRTSNLPLSTAHEESDEESSSLKSSSKRNAIMALSEGSKSLTSFFPLVQTSDLMQPLDLSGGKSPKESSPRRVSTGSMMISKSSPYPDGQDDDDPVDHDSNIAMAVQSMTGSTIKDNKERNARRLNELRTFEGNSICADCGRSDPRWASWNLGVFICISCSGVHRSLGTHISKVRSVDLDDWSDSQLRNMEQIGNKLANEKWEALLPPAEKPGPESTNVADFIKVKYSDKKWVRTQ